MNAAALDYLDELYPQARRTRTLRRKLQRGGYLRPLALSVLEKRFGARDEVLDQWVETRLAPS